MNICFAPCPVVFDLDGTLIDSVPDIHACVNAVLRLHGVAPLTLDQVRGFVGGGVDLLWRRVIGTTGLPAEAHRDLVASFMTRYHDATGLTRLYPNVTEALGILADRGYPLGLCTNKPLGPTRAILDHFGIAHLFGMVIGGDSLPQRKPDPAPLRAAFAGLGADPLKPRGVYVGDSEFDEECASNTGVPFLLFTHGYRKTPVEQMAHHGTFDDFAHLPLLVEETSAVG
ncbi:phosphoglycolate phosphatase [Paracoccus denitrificans]|jgi:phosphoglycolate phosphatase|uniref:Phosphoglycolate phosphatase n=1 Tax=Paracoccus denitrificans (strain Pd 1222) TaxID=318586 RepID=A1B995_PARDP|nr:phosphoglycolate phosphatase [Paracoccus denitrificans]ABL72089.1 phosphoglycolate phosphatase [Paracoccus denitrificans PD1222]MBB4626001.1 phosphoglycolate phosphatase [Paracoccus denitrificans]MCU7426839.1 phosphoglycolate phosphatase [Paracoccus denitrificans]QAR28668.1 phosphoglycolate phosphatase [Paracoccus denitrificans]UFS66483.1 phosphoglycolate phosphatase [Paracoccus denitrificans]